MKTKTSFTLVVALVALIAGLFFSNKPVLSAGASSGVSSNALTVSAAISYPSRLARCHGTIHPTAGKNNGFGHPMCLPVDDGTGADVEKVIVKTPVVIVEVVTTTTENPVTGEDTTVDETETPAVEDAPKAEEKPEVVKEDKKPACNNGNGNGGEGCNASEKGNNDETEVKHDKASEHPEKKH